MHVKKKEINGKLRKIISKFSQFKNKDKIKLILNRSNGNFAYTKNDQIKNKIIRVIKLEQSEFQNIKTLIGNKENIRIFNSESRKARPDRAPPWFLIRTNSDNQRLNI